LQVASPVRAPAPPPDLLATLLREQGSMTAVERFARKHDEGTLPAQARYYRDLIPLDRPRPGQQYAFEVNLDTCTGCKACVAACHSLNGLDETEIWRTVGLLHGGTPEAPAQQTVTTACHHCVEPACMLGCPVKAYEKDPVTGIVKHLDDQCIGCQYCTLMCPYDAPKYSKARGIVRKCDLCSDRLAVGEAPACVQACPNEAIRVKIIDQAQAVEASEAGTFLPGAPTPEHTIPTTVYKSAKALPRNMLPADFYSVSPEHPHMPLVIMLVFTQLAVGAFVMGLGAHLLLGAGAKTFGLWHALGTLGVAGLALGAATFHLGRPQFAFRALLGLRTSWMSREALAFMVFPAAAALYALALLPESLPRLPLVDGLVRAALELVRPRQDLLAIVAGASGLTGIFCSAMIYAATRRSHWRTGLTNVKFFGTTLLLGTAAALLGGAVVGAPGATRPLALAVLGVGVGKLLVEAAVLRHLRDRQHSVMKRVARLMTGDLKVATFWRFVAGLVGAVALPLLLLRVGPAAAPGLAGTALAALVVGELLERYLFFKAAPASRMPGALG
jgi:Fe-S-cluster-containing dehydrogenase component/DMSO reductase anchor subunit